MIDRRKFLKIPLAGSALVLAGRVAGQKGETVSSASSGRPVVVSTWHSGVIANNAAWSVLTRQNGQALDAVEAGGRASEAEPGCCVGLAAWPDRDGRVTLDSCIMKGNGDCGAVSFLERIKHPVSVARKVMERTPHILLSGEGAQKFALANGFSLEDGKLSPDAEKEWKKWLEKSKYQPGVNVENRQSFFPPTHFEDGTPNHDTMATIAMDYTGKLAGMVTTSGVAFKMRGRVGDSPIIGAGLFVDDEVGAATSSGVGEEVIRVCGSHTVIEQMRAGRSPEEACREAIRRIVKRDPEKIKGKIIGKENTGTQVGFIALAKNGQIGAFSIQKGFTYAVRSSAYPEGKIFESKSWL